MIGEGLRARQSMEVFEKPMHARIGGDIDEADLLTCRLTFAAQVFGYFVGKAEFSARQKKQPPLRRLPQGAISRRSVLPEPFANMWAMSPASFAETCE